MTSSVQAYIPNRELGHRPIIFRYFTAPILTLIISLRGKIRLYMNVMFGRQNRIMNNGRVILLIYQGSENVREKSEFLNVFSK